MAVLPPCPRRTRVRHGFASDAPPIRTERTGGHFHGGLPSATKGTLSGLPSAMPKQWVRNARQKKTLEDEWFVVFLRYEVSRNFSSFSIRVWDSDGEFILIEAAFSLPRWLNPENSENRVFVRGGEVHVMGKRLLPVEENVGLMDAIRALESGEKETRASDAVQLIMRKKVGEYPEKARRNMHRVRVRIPLPVAQVLKHEPSLISLAVEGFYDRDVDSMKHAAKMEKFLSSKKGSCVVDMVQVRVRMSRAMYGQLVQQNFQAPRCYPMPSRDEGPVSFAEAELGTKVALDISVDDMEIWH